MLISVGGIVLFASTYGFKGPTTIGIVLTVIAACGSALYQVIIINSFHNSSILIPFCTDLLLPVSFESIADKI